MPIPIHGTTFPERRYTGVAGTVRDFACLSQPVVTLGDSELPEQPAHLPCPPFGAAVKNSSSSMKSGTSGTLSPFGSGGEVVMTAVFHARISRRRHRRPHGHGFVPFAFGGNVVRRGFAVSDSPGDTRGDVTIN